MNTPEIIQTVGAALTTQQQLFVSANLAQLLPWLRTDLGKLALQTFVADWQAAMKTGPGGPAEVEHTGD